MAKIGRLGDPFDDGDFIAQGSANVFVNGLPASKVGDMTTGHEDWPPVAIIDGASTVFVNGVPLVRVGSHHDIHCNHDDDCHDATLIDGSDTVNVE
ncbi:hypothetical protein RsoM2USA_426 [Ralstonia phage RsoM2USA]|nr:hypothetical protein RsoM2USA_426 [Ralstonia phage RsoM2USA]